MSINRLNDMLASLEGLVVGDAFGDQLPLKPERAQEILDGRILRTAPWRWTDDSNMAFDIVAMLRDKGAIYQDDLSRNWAKHYDVKRGYGPSAHRIMLDIQKGESWQTVNRKYTQNGSYGNGGAMRVAPLGAYFADDMGKVIEQATLSAEITHAHPEGIAGAVAIAVAAALAVRLQGNSLLLRNEFLEQVIQHMPDSEVKHKIEQAKNLPDGTTPHEAANRLGDGRYITAQDTIGYVLWCAATHLADYTEAMWFTLSASGDRDTNCAIVGGIVAAYTGINAIPQQWRDSHEPYPQWF
jgi:ADP-ribosylglycohydrolase